jgi:PAS domain S-box-containing protein
VGLAQKDSSDAGVSEMELDISIRAALPSDDSQRLEALHRYEVLDTPPEERFDRFTRAAAQIFGVSSSTLSLIDDHRQFFKSCNGKQMQETPRDVAFCGQTILSDDVMVVTDALQDARFRENPLVTGEPKIRFYAGAPLKTGDGLRIGTLCVIDFVPRPHPPEWKLDVLRDMAAAVVEQLEYTVVRRNLRAFEAELRRHEYQLNKHRERVRQSEHRAALALEAGELGTWEWDAATGRAVSSPTLSRIFGKDTAVAQGKFAGLSGIHPDDRPKVLAILKDVNRGGNSFRLNFRILRPSGETRWVAAMGSAHRSESGRLQGITALCSDVTSRELADRELRDSEELFRRLSVSCPVGIFRSDLSGLVTYVNPRTAEMWQMPVEAMLGAGWIERLHPEDVGPLVERWTAANKTGQSYGQEFRLVLPDGSIRWVQGRSAVVYDQDGRTTATVGTVDDITERKRVQQELHDAKEAAEHANRAKDLFLANVSHELRTPLNGVLGMADVLLGTKMTHEQRDLTETVRNSGQTLLNVVNDILDLSRIEAGTFRLECAPFDLRQTVSNAMALLQIQAKAKGLRLEVDYPQTLGSVFVGDADRIQQILVNYLTNALKFTDCGGVTMRVEEEPKENGSTRLTLSVSDSGPGISEEAQPTLFRPFTQVDGSSTRRHGGVGLGLAISKRLAELMGGRVWVTSELGSGSAFFLQLELMPVGAATAEVKSEEERRMETPERETVKSTSVHQGRLLLAEDNAINQKVAKHLLAKLGWTVDIVADGASALERVQQNEYAAILMDCQMPKVDGYMATSMIRSYEAGQPGVRTPIIAVTAHAMAGDRDRCLAAGMDDYVAKPLQLENLRCVLERWSQDSQVFAAGDAARKPEQFRTGSRG